MSHVLDPDLGNSHANGSVRDRSLGVSVGSRRLDGWVAPALARTRAHRGLDPRGGGNDGVFQEGVKVCRWGAEGEGHGLDADGPAGLRARGGSEARPASGLRVIAVVTRSLAMLRPPPPTPSCPCTSEYHG